MTIPLTRHRRHPRRGDVGWPIPGVGILRLARKICTGPLADGHFQVVEALVELGLSRARAQCRGLCSWWASVIDPVRPFSSYATVGHRGGGNWR